MRPRTHLHRALLPVLWIVLILTPAFRAARPLPTELSDVEFWQLVTNVSEEGGSFISENLVSNELGYPYVMPALIERVPPGGAYIGVGPEQNFTYMAAIRPSIAFIVDIRRQNMIEHLLYKAVFELSANREEFVSRLFARNIGSTVRKDATPAELFDALAASQQDPNLYQSNLDSIMDLLVTKHGFALGLRDQSTIEHIYEEFSRLGGESKYAVSSAIFSNGRVFAIQEPNGVISLVPGPVSPNGPPPNVTLGVTFPTYAEVMKAADPSGKVWSYLASESNYQFVRELHKKNLIVPVVGDFAGPKAIQAIGQYLKGHNATIAAFYVSNVEQYLTPVTKLQSFHTNVATLPLNESSTFIRSAQTPGVQPGLAQSSLSPMQMVVDAVLEGRAQNWNDILRLTAPKVEK